MAWSLGLTPVCLLAAAKNKSYVSFGSVPCSHFKVNLYFADCRLFTIIWKSTVEASDPLW
jgi:hypothetical protein